jgi:uncharacterized protein YkwD
MVAPGVLAFAVLGTGTTAAPDDAIEARTSLAQAVGTYASPMHEADEAVERPNGSMRPAPTVDGALVSVRTSESARSGAESAPRVPIRRAPGIASPEAPPQVAAPAPAVVAQDDASRTSAEPATVLGAVASAPAEPTDRTEGSAAAASPLESAGPETTALNARAVGLLHAMNAARAAEGLAPLALAADLTRIAQLRSDDMVANNYFAHVSPSGDSWISLMNRDGIRVRAGGENLARVAGTEERSVAVAIHHLMDSATHRANILGSFQEVGVAAVTDAQGVTLFTAIFATR